MFNDVFTYDALGVAVLSRHCQVQPEQVAVDNIDVASLGTTQSVDSAIEWFVGANLDSDTSVFTVNGHCDGENTKKAISATANWTK